MHHKFISLILILTIQLTAAQEHQCQSYLDSLNRTTIHCDAKDHNLSQFPQTIDANVEVFIFTGTHNPEYSDPKMGEMFMKLPNLIEFKISYTKIKFIPKRWLEKSTKLVKLDLSNNKISEFFRDTWVNLINLKILDLSGNRIDDFHLESYFFGHMSKLEILDLSHNDIRTLSDGILGNLTNLKELRLEDNKLVALKENAIYGSLMNLNFLNVSHCLLNESVTKFLDRIPNLQTIDMSHNSLERVAENHFQNLTKLAYVDLSSNMLMRLEDFVFVSLDLDYLDLSNNQLVNLSRNAFKDTKCKKLKLSNNHNLNIQQLVAALNNLKEVEDLDLSRVNITDNDLESRLFDSQSHYMKKLNLSNNQLTRLPQMPTFRLIDLELDFSFNRINKLNQIETKIPKIFDKLKTQTHLYLHHNPLSCLKCDLDTILAINLFNRKCEANEFYCLKCHIPGSVEDFDLRNLTALNETDLPSCDLPVQLTRLFGSGHKSDFNYILLIVIIVIVLSIFTFLALLYRRYIFQAIYYPNDQGESKLMRKVMREKLYS